MTNIAVSGATGRMGKTLILAICADKDARLSVALERKGSLVIGKPLASIIGIDANLRKIKITDALNKNVDFDVLIDFTLPEVTDLYINECLNLGRPIVIGTTGLSSAQKDNIVKAAEKIPIFYAPNMSLGVNICYKLIEACAKYLDNNWQVAISEIHHQHKKDAPSGTALEMGKIIAACGKHMASALQFNSMRCGDIRGEHTVLFANEGERIEITHRASSRKAYAQGALKAAKWIIGKKPGLYSMQDVI